MFRDARQRGRRRAAKTLTEKNVDAALDASADSCNNHYMATPRKTTRTVTASDLIRQRMAESRLAFIELERRTGVKRQCLMKFARGEQSLRLDIAEKLFDCLGLELVKKRNGR